MKQILHLVQLKYLSSYRVVFKTVPPKKLQSTEKLLKLLKIKSWVKLD